MQIKYEAKSSAGSITGFDEIDKNAPLPAEQTSLHTCLKYKVTENVERPSYSNPEVMEKITTLRFLLGSKDANGNQVLVQTREFKLSFHPKSNLVSFLTNWYGKALPTDGSLTLDDFVGKGAQLTISHAQTRRGTTYAQISGIAPVITELQDKVLPLNSFKLNTEEVASEEDPY